MEEKESALFQLSYRNYPVTKVAQKAAEKADVRHNPMGTGTESERRLFYDGVKKTFND